MSEYKYWLDISGNNHEELNKALAFLEAEGIVPGTLVVDSADQGYGPPFACLSTEELLPDGTCKGWDAESHEKFFNDMSVKIPGITLEFRGVCVDDPNNEMFLKAFHNGQYREVWQDNSDLSERLSEVPWHPYGSSEQDYNNNLRRVYVLACTHECKDGLMIYPSIHESTEAALKHVDAEKAVCSFSEDEIDREFFNYDIKECIVDISKLMPYTDLCKGAEIPELTEREETLRLFRTAKEQLHSKERAVAGVMVEISNGVARDIFSEELLYSAAERLYSCWEKHPLGVSLDEYASAFSALLSNGADFNWCEKPDSGTWNVEFIFPDFFRNTLLSISPDVMDYFMSLYLTDQGGIMSLDSDVLIPLLDSLGIEWKKNLDMAISGARERASNQSASMIPEPTKDERSV